MKQDNVYQVFNKCAWLGAASGGQGSLGRNTANGGENRELLTVKAELEFQYLVGHSSHRHRTRWAGCMRRCIPTFPAFPQTLTAVSSNRESELPSKSTHPKRGDPAGFHVTQVYGRAKQNTSIVISLLCSGVESLEHEQCELSSSHHKLHMELELTL